MRRLTLGLELIVGGIFSGKSEELIRRVKPALIARRSIQVFRPALDDRYWTEIVRSHDGDSFVATPVRSASEMLNLVAPDTSLVAVDEVQFFGPDVVDVAQRLVADGRRVHVRRTGPRLPRRALRPRAAAPRLAERVDKLTAICVVYGEAATRTQRIVNGVPAFYEDPLVIVGGAESYHADARSAEQVDRGEAPRSGAARHEARCRACHEVPRRAPTPAR